MADQVSAGVVVIGDEILSGRTRDINIQQIAEFLGPLGISLKECRVVSDEEDAIVEAVRALSERCTYVFTTGGIGPTHDDITADAVAAAFGRSIGVREDARKILEAWYDKSGTEITDARLRMARIPEGAVLIDNPVTGAPGFQLENVFVLAGVPKIARGMLEDVAARLDELAPDGIDENRIFGGADEGVQALGRPVEAEGGAWPIEAVAAVGFEGGILFG